MSRGVGRKSLLLAAVVVGAITVLGAVTSGVQFLALAPLVVPPLFMMVLAVTALTIYCCDREVDLGDGTRGIQARPAWHPAAAWAVAILPFLLWVEADGWSALMTTLCAAAFGGLCGALNKRGESPLTTTTGTSDA
jgi:hypothetical protein